MTPSGDDTSTATPGTDRTEATHEARATAPEGTSSTEPPRPSTTAPVNTDPETADCTEATPAGTDAANNTTAPANTHSETAGGTTEAAPAGTGATNSATAVAGSDAETAGGTTAAAHADTEAGKTATAESAVARAGGDGGAGAEVADDDGDIVDELLIQQRHPSDGLGVPGPPIRRGNPFAFGFFAALGVLVAWGLWNALGQARSVLILLLVSIFIAVGLNPLVEWFMRRGLKRGLSVGVVFLLMIMAVAGVGFAIVPVVTDQINSLIKNAPEWLDLLSNSKTVDDLDNKYHFIQKAQDYIQDPALAQRAFGGILGVGKVVANALFNTFTILVLTLYFLASLPTVKRAAYSLVPRTRRARVSILGDEVLGRVGGYVSGQFMVALCAGVCMFIFLEIIGLREYAVALAIVVMFCDFIPMVGGLIGVVVVSLIAFTGGLWIGLAALIYGVIYQQIENYVVAPRIMRRAVDIPGAVTVIAALLGGALLGVVGALLAIPSAAAILLIIREVWVRKADAS